MGFSDQQKIAIDHGFDNILVSAAAGSGKTTVLVERIVQKILSGEVSLDRLAVMTFTVAAADNMVAKINKAIRKRLAEEKDPSVIARLKEQLNYLPSAYIQTTNSFCSRIIREKGCELDGFDLESGLSILGDAEKKILLKRAAYSILEEKYLSFDSEDELKSSPFMKLVNSFGDGRSDDELVDNLVSVFSKLRSLPDYLDKTEKDIKRREKIDNEGKILFIGEIVRKMKNSFELALSSAQNTLDNMDFYDLKKGNREMIEQILEEVILSVGKVLSTDTDEEGLFDLMCNCLKQLATIDHPYIAQWKKEFKDDYAPCCALIVFSQREIRGCGALIKPYKIETSYADVFEAGREKLLEKQKTRTLILREFNGLLRELDSAYMLSKKRLRTMDYSDQEHYAKLILSDPEIGKHYREKFCEIYVDEYQDNSSLQDSIIELIANHNVFLVGDVKQSIYKFRYADPSNFIRRSEMYKGDNNPEGELIPLNINFRSTKQILNFVNVVFRQLMSGDATEIEYDEDQFLNHDKDSESASSDDNELPKVVCTFAESNNEENTGDDGVIEVEDDVDYSKLTKAFSMEMKVIVREVKEYLQRPGTSPKDICVLTRSNARARDIALILELLGIPAVCDDARNIYEDSDIATICSLITVLGNEHRDECLVGVLLAGYRFSNFTLDELAKITLYASEHGLIKINLIEKLRYYANQKKPENFRLYEKVIGFLNKLDDLRSESMMFNIGELIEKIYAYTGILATIKADKKGDVNKLRSFKKWMCDRFADEGSDIAAVANALEELKIEMSDSVTYDYEHGQKDAVAVMTEHKSKGLEYPFVIVTQLSNRLKGTKAQQIEFDDKIGFVSYDYEDGDEITLKKSLETHMFEDRIRLSIISEELRLLYVAFTRAMQKLTVVINFAISDDRKPFFVNAFSAKEEKYSRDIHLAAKSIYEEMILALGRLGAAEDIREKVGVAAVPYVEHITDFNAADIEMVSFDDVDVPSYIPSFEGDTILNPSLSIVKFNDYGEPVFADYAYQDSITAPSKTSVSEMKREEQKLLYSSDLASKHGVAINLVVPKLEYFEDRDSYKTASAKGTLIHNLLHFMDFPSILADIESGKSTKEALDSEISFLKDRGIIKDDMLPVLKEFDHELEVFFSSVVFKRIASAEKNGKADFERPILFSTKVGDTNDDTLVQGVLDVIFLEGDEAIIVDYKTDKIPTDDITEIEKIVKERHGMQLDLYAASVEASGIKVKEKIVWLIRKEMAVNL